MAIVKAFTFAGISNFGGFSLQAICGACLVNDEQIDQDSQCPSQSLTDADQKSIQ